MSNAPPDSLGPRRPSGGRVILFGLLVGLFEIVTLLIAAVLRGTGGERVPVASITALLLLAATPMLGRLAAWSGAPRARVAGALSALGAAPLLFVGALIAMGEPILSSHWRCGTGDAMLAMIAPIPFFLLGATGALAACALARNDRRRVDTLIRVARKGALVFGVVLVAGASSRAVWRPDPEHYLASLPQAFVVPPVSGEPIEIHPADERTSMGGERRVYEDRLGDIVVHRECTSGSCQLALRPADDPLPPETRKWHGMSVNGDAPLVVTRDAKHDLWVVGRQMAFQGPDFRVIDIQVETVADRLSPPLGWILGAALGLLVAGGLAVQRRRLSRRLQALVAAVAGVHNRNGWITVDDNLPAFRAAPDLALPEGPVLIVSGSGGSAGGAYRGDGALRDAEILAGERSCHTAAIGDRIAVLDAFALSAVLLTIAPLAAAWLRGLIL